MWHNVMAMGSSGIGSDIQSGRTECQGRFCDRREAGLLLPIAVVVRWFLLFLVSYYLWGNSIFSLFQLDYCKGYHLDKH